MRFHIGFSKRISIKKLIEIIGFLFVACLTFFGIYENAHAWTDINPTNFDREITDSQFMKDNNFEASNVSYNADNYSIYSITSNKFYVLGLTNYASSINYVTDLRTFKLNNNFNHTCSTSDNSLKSIDFKFRIQNQLYPTGSNYTSAIAKFNQTISSNLYNFYVYAHDSTNDVDYSTACTDVESYDSNYDLQNINVSCDRVFSGNSNYQIDYFKIGILNAIPFNDFYLNNSTDYPIGSFYMTLYEIQYQCDEQEPNVDGGFPDNTDPAGLNDIYDKIKDNYNDNINGIELINPPVDYLSLINLPFALFNAVIDSNDATCTPYEIDFSSIMRKWGSNDSSYVLRLPCMRDTLQNIIGNNLYNLADTLICFYLIYKICMFIVRMVSAVLSGEDLFDFYFGKSERNIKE